MLVRCNPKCKLSDGMTDGSLDVDSDSAICNNCGEELETVSSYLKKSMKQNGDIMRSNKRKAFVFSCKTCDKDVETIFKTGRLVGKTCSDGQKSCKIDITTHMTRVIMENEESG